MPQLDVRPFADNVDNVAILNTIRDNATSEYFNRVPEATQANVQATLQGISEYEPLWNEFVSGLINKIGQTIIRNKVWKNKLARWKKGMLTYGDTIEEITVGFIKSHTYNYDRESLEKDVFGNYPPEVASRFHRINRQEYYPITVKEDLLRRAFLTPNGLSDFVTAIMSAPTNSNEFDEFLIMTNLLGEWYKAGGFFKVNVPDIFDPESTQADARRFLRILRGLAGNLSVPNTAYNSAGMPTFANPEEMVLITTPEALAAIDVEALAGAFNLDKTDIQYRIEVIPAKYWHIPGAQAILTSEDFFVMVDTLIRTTSQPNPVTLGINYFFHIHSILSLSPFVPAILLTTEPGDDDTIVITPVTGVSAVTVADNDGDVVTNVERGGMYQILAEATTTGDNKAVRLELTGNNTNKTRLHNQTGVLYVSDIESASSLTITAYAVDSLNPQLSSEVVVTVSGDQLQLWPNPEIQEDVDSDGLEEVTPEAIVLVDGKVKIPNVKDVQYKKGGVNVNANTVHDVAAPTTFTAVAKAGKEITTGATVSWTVG